MPKITLARTVTQTIRQSVTFHSDGLSFDEVELIVTAQVMADHDASVASALLEEVEEKLMFGTYGSQVEDTVLSVSEQSAIDIAIEK
jgi:hypothetical protein